MERKATVCIVEDEALIAEDIRMILLDLGYHVSKVLHHSDQAIDYLSFHTPDLVLCDINIKGPKDGIEVATIIRKKKALPFVFLTSLSDRTTIERARSALPYGYIVKPFDERDLLASIEIALYKYQQEVEELTLTRSRLEAIWSSSFTDKEYDIIEQILQGHSYEKVMEELDITKNTLKYHTKNIYSKSKVSNKAEFLQVLLAHYLHL